MKKFIFLLFALCCLFLSMASQASHYIGEQALGGTVFITNGEGTHGLVVANRDQGYSGYRKAQNLCTNRKNHDQDGKNYFDWRLPSENELKLLYDVRKELADIINISNIRLWVYSATEYAEYIYFDNFSVHYTSYFPAYVRCVRSF